MFEKMEMSLLENILLYLSLIGEIKCFLLFVYVCVTDAHLAPTCVAEYTGTRIRSDLDS